MNESRTLARLDHVVRAARAQGALDLLADEVEQRLLADASLRLAWATVPLHTYASLPDDIASSWIFVLWANSTSGAERHPNSIQRVMSLRGSADMQLWRAGRWESNILVDDSSPIGDRWLSIPRNVWHKPVMGESRWVVVSFHTAGEDTLIAELAADDEHPNAGSRAPPGVSRTVRAVISTHFGPRFQRPRGNQNRVPARSWDRSIPHSNATDRSIVSGRFNWLLRMRSTCWDRNSRGRPWPSC